MSLKTAFDKTSGFELRPSRTEDIEWAYPLFKLSMQKYVEQLAGTWPEPWQYNFFKGGFEKRPIQIIEHEGKPVGFFAIDEEEKRVTVQRMYIDPAWKGKGIGSWIIHQGIERAHQTRKPFETEVLTTNLPALEFYKNIGFEVFGRTRYDWVREYKIRHKDTLQYVPKADINLHHDL